MKHRDMFKVLEGEDGHVVVVGDDDDNDDVKCFACHFAGDALCSRPIINQHKSGRESKRECFVVSLLHFQRSVSTFPTVEWRGKIIWREANDRICALRLRKNCQDMTATIISI